MMMDALMLLVLLVVLLYTACCLVVLIVCSSVDTELRSYNIYMICSMRTTTMCTRPCNVLLCTYITAIVYSISEIYQRRKYYSSSNAT